MKNSSAELGHPPPISLSSETVSNLIATSIHDLKAPLAAILGYCDLLTDPSDRTARHTAHFIERITYNARMMNELIIRHLESFKAHVDSLIEFSPTPVAVRSFFTECLEHYSMLANKKNLQFDVQFQASLPDELLLDQLLCHQVLRNLVDNAFKFTESGCIDVSVAYQAEEETLVINVRDSGRGIACEDFETIFEPFVQGNASCLNRVYGGVGLGLSNARKLARLMRGDVKVIESQIDLGTSFEFTLRASTGLTSS